MVRYIPDAVVPAGAPTIAAADFAPASAPIGSVNALLDRLTGSYGALDRAIIRSAYNRLQEGGVFALLDTFATKLGNETDSLLNWTGGPDGTVSGGPVFGAKGFQLDGLDDYINPNFSRDGAGKYTLTLAHMGAYVSAVPNPDANTMALLGQSQGSVRVQLYPRNAGPTAAWRVNVDTNTFATHDRPLTGLWHMGRGIFSGVATQVLFHGGLNLGQQALSPVGLPPNSVLIGRASSFWPMAICGWFSGAYIATAPRAVLVDVFEMLRAHFVGAIS